MKRVLAIMGSPRENGSTAAMLRCALKAAVDSGWDITTVSLYEKQIAYCKGCRACMKTKACVIDDDLREIADLLCSCDRVILAAPTYWANVPGIVKNLFDRLYGTVMEETATFPRPRLSADQDYLLLTACNTPAPFSWIFNQNRGALRAMKEFFKTAGMKHLGSVSCCGTKGRTELPRYSKKKIERYWR